MATEELLREQDWASLQIKLTAFAHKHTRGRSMDRARDLAQSAITAVFTRPQSWDPEKDPLLKHLAKCVIGLARNEWTRKRHALEVLLRKDDDELPDLDDEQDSLEDVLDRRRLAAQFRARLEERLAGDEIGLTLVALMTEGSDTPLALAKASGLDLAQVKEARRRVFYHSELVSREMDHAIERADDARMDEADEEEVAQ